MPAILDDLEIDSSDMLSNPRAFADRVVAKSQELRKILKESISVASYTENVREASEKEKVPAHIQKMIDDLYIAVDALPVEQIQPVIVAVRRLAGDFGLRAER